MNIDPTANYFHQVYGMSDEEADAINDYLDQRLMIHGTTREEVNLCIRDTIIRFSDGTNEQLVAVTSVIVGRMMAMAFKHSAIRLFFPLHNPN